MKVVPLLKLKSKKKKMIKISITDDHQLFRSGVAMLLKGSNEFEVVIQTSSGEELIQALSHFEVDVALIDINMKQMNGLDTISEIKKVYPSTKSIVLTMHNDGPYVVKAIKNGAWGYLLKDCGEEELKNAIRDVANGKKYLNPAVSEILLDSMTSENEVDTLSKRELEILKLVSEGKTAKQIAQELFISARTVETHRRNMLKKLGVQNSLELINKASSLGMLS